MRCEASDGLLKGPVEIPRLMTSPSEEEVPLCPFRALGCAEGFKIVSSLNMASHVSVGILREEQERQEENLQSSPPRLERDCL